MKIGIVGLGLMGGSFALDLKSLNGGLKIFGHDNSVKNAEKALKIGFIDEIIDLSKLRDMDVVVVAVPVDVSLN